METCKFFLQSRCTKGDLCLFSHERPRTVAKTPSTGPTKRALCIYFREGKCRNGTKCTFEHSDPLTLPTTTVPVDHVGRTSSEQLPTSTVDARSLVTCRFFSRNSCTKGAACPYQHPAELPAQLGEEQEYSEALESKDASGSLQRALLGAFVQFDHGAVIQKLSLASDFSSVRVDSMDFTSDVESVIDVARKLGFHVEPDNVRLLPMTQNTTRSAQITVEDPTFEKSFCDKLRTDPSLKGLTATVVSPRLPSWAASRRINCKKVVVSWHRPTRLVWLNFGQKLVAQRVSDKFNRGQYQIAGRRVKAGDPTGVADHHNRKGITVLLHNAPYCTTRTEVFDAIIAEHDKPRHVELSKTTSLYSADNSLTLVKTLLLQIGPLDFTDITKEESKRYKAVALFNDENDARQAVTALHDKAQRLLNNDKLSLQLMSSSKFKISSKIYHAVEQQIAGHIPGWREDHLSFRVYPESAAQLRFVTLKVEGESVKAVAKATNTIDEIITGKLVEIEGKPCWSSSLASNGALFEDLKRIETTYGVVILRNKQKRHLRYFGPPHLYAAALETIVAQIKSDASTAHIIHLDDCQFVWACRGGFNQVSTVLGVKAATFDITSTPKKIIITGSDEQYRKALAILNAASTRSIAGDMRSNDEEDCAICWTSAEDPMTLHCGHIYCLDCFERLCMSGDANGSGFAIECQGGAGTCKAVVTSQELRDHLSSTALEDVLEASFASYVRRRPQELRYCPSPDCGYIYRTNPSAKFHTCVKCLEPICTSCYEQHGTMSCADYKDLASGRYEAFEKFKKEMNVKDCPKCKTPMEKTMGCNHMTCGGCGVHIC
ncbi:hypothetical protein AC578_11071 [Pseudocercospora eumusae]|uniref:RBR-type E3 ubiquitin transferase n=1 Tax=Pseudocercospora eumusae TaxID=321146 RepID=A0A139HSN1_9PEZI|nr:hypothetical protein AC578_11071 [Pseudocercospora eumusae]